MPDSAPQRPHPAQPAGVGAGTTALTVPAAAAAPPPPVGVFGKILIGLSGLAWLAAVVVTALMVLALLAGELEGMVALSGIVIIAIAVGVALLMTGVTLLHLYLARRRSRSR